MTDIDPPVVAFPGFVRVSRRAWWAAATVCLILAMPAMGGVKVMRIDKNKPAQTPGADLKATGERIPNGFGGTTSITNPMTPETPGVTITEHKGDIIPLDLRFTDENGHPVTLGQYFKKGRPVLLTLNYYSCPMLCPLVLTGVAQSLKPSSLVPGKDYEVITVSFDPADTPSLAKHAKEVYDKKVGKEGIKEGWHFLTGDKASIRALTEAVGFGYRWLPEQKSWAHTAAIMILSPKGKITRYLYGIKFASGTVRLSLIQASNGQIGTTIDRFLLTCCQFDPNTGKYTWMAMALMKVMGATVLTGLIIVIGVLFVAEYLRRRRGHAAI